MELHALICPTCGQPLERDGGLYRCEYCLSSFEAERGDGVAEALSSALEEEKIERLANARKLLYDATHHDRKVAKYPIKDTVVNAARAVLAIHQDEPFAQITLHSYDADPYALVQTLGSLNVDPRLADDVYRWLLPSLTPRLLGPLNDFLCRHFKNEERTERLNELEAEAAKLDDGTYVHTLRRDVFLAYSSADMAKVLEIVDALEENGLTVFAAFRNLRHGRGAAENYLSALKEAMRACACFVFLSSDSSRQMTCDAMSVELPFLTGELPEKPRIEYMLSDYPDRMPFMVKSTLKSAFPEQEQCRDLESLVTRVYAIKTSKPSSSKVDEEALRKQIEEETRKKIEEENARRLEEEYKKMEEEEASRPTDAVCNLADFEIEHGVLIQYKGRDKYVEIPLGVTHIGNKAFDHCRSLKSIIIPVGVTGIGDYAFRECNSLTSVVIPSSLTYIGSDAFGDCPSLARISVDPANEKFDSRGGCNAIIETATNELIVGCAKTVIPEGIKSIGWGAFSGCTSLESIVLPSSLLEIEGYAFCDCSSLKTVYLPFSLSSIGVCAFSGCASLPSLVLPSSVTSIAKWAFYGCTCTLKISGAEKGLFGKISYPKGFAEGFLEGFQGTVTN